MSEISMAISSLYLKRTEAMIGFEEGRLIEAEHQLSALIDTIGRPQTRPLKGELCACLLNRATVRRFSNQWEKALSDLVSCEKWVPELAPLLQASILMQIYFSRAEILATPYSSLFDPPAALKNVIDFRALNHSSWAADGLESKLAFYNRDWDRASQLAKQAAAALSTEGWLAGAAQCRRLAGEAYLEGGKLNQAEIELKFVQAFFLKNGPPDQLAATFLALARLKSRSGEQDGAWDLVCQALDGIEDLIRDFHDPPSQQRFLIDKLKFYDYAFDIGLARGGIEGTLRAWTIAERAKSFYLCQLIANSDIPVFADIAPEEIRQLKDLESQLDLYERNKATCNQNSARAVELEARCQQISQQRQDCLFKIMRENPRWAALRKPPRFSMAVLLSRLGSDYAPLSYFWRENPESATQLYLFFVDRNQVPAYQAISWTRTELEVLDNCQKKLQGAVDVFDPVIPPQLAAKLIPPEVVSSIGAGHTILISPHGRLHNIPLHVISLPEDDYLISRWPVQYVPTFSINVADGPDPKEEAVLLIGCPENAFNDPKLEGVEAEISSLSQVWSEKLPGCVKPIIIAADQSPGSAGCPIDSWINYRYIHIASHGYFPAGEPFNAALRLGSDALRTSEFFAAHIGARLVCLSACQLGRSVNRIEQVGSAGDEWLGLFLPLFYAGVQYLVVSLWNANDEIAADLMKTLHTHLSQNLTPAVAFQQAVISVSDRFLPLWANWYLVGSPAYKI
jgi:CHAT domain-containing protein